jgi:hypothetical protein
MSHPFSDGAAGGKEAQFRRPEGRMPSLRDPAKLNFLARVKAAKISALICEARRT